MSRGKPNPVFFHQSIVARSALWEIIWDVVALQRRLEGLLEVEPDGRIDDALMEIRGGIAELRRGLLKLKGAR